MIPTEQDREKLTEKLMAEQFGRWRTLKSELQYFGRQMLFFFLIDDPRQIDEIVSLFRRVAADDVERFNETEFELGFTEIRGEKKIIWDVVVDDEIRGKFPARSWGEYPAQFDLGEDELFAEYIGKK